MARTAVARQSKRAQRSRDPSEALARRLAESAWEKKAQGLRILDVRGIASYTDYLVICSANTERHAAAIAGQIQDDLAKTGARLLGTEGLPPGRWVLLDYGDAVVHVFTESERDVYGLDSVWADAPEVPVTAPPGLERREYSALGN